MRRWTRAVQSCDMKTRIHRTGTLASTGEATPPDSLRRFERPRHHDSSIPSDSVESSAKAKERRAHKRLRKTSHSIQNAQVARSNHKQQQKSHDGNPNRQTQQAPLQFSHHIVLTNSKRSANLSTPPSFPDPPISPTTTFSQPVSSAPTCSNGVNKARQDPTLRTLWFSQTTDYNVRSMCTHRASSPPAASHACSNKKEPTHHTTSQKP